MKVLLISVDFPPHHDGVSSVSYHYASGLAARGHEVSVVGPCADGDRQMDQAANFHVYRFRGYGLGLLRFFPFTLCSLRAFLRHRPDVVLAMNIGYGGLLCYLLAGACRCRYVTMAYAYEFLKFRNRRVLRALYNCVYRRSRMTVAISRFARDRLIDFGVATDAIRIVYPGVDTREQAGGGGTARSGQAQDYPGPVIGTCGRLIRRKGHDLVIKALPELVRAHPAIKYVIAGRGPEEQTLRELASQLGVEAQVVFLGVVPSCELASFYRSLDLFVMPSRDDVQSGHAEGFGIVFLEAAVQGVPSIGSRTGGIAEAIVDGRTGLVVPPESPHELAAAIQALLSDADRRTSMGEMARERAVREFNWDAQVDLIDDMLGNLS